MKLDLDKIRETKNIEFLAKQVVEGFITGLHKSPYHGFSVEFAEHKLYNQGESTKNIDWKLFGKSDKLFIKKYNEETNLRTLIVLDNSSSMHYPTHNRGKINIASCLAASLAQLLTKQKDAVGINTFAEGLEIQTDIKTSTSHLHKLFNILQKILDENDSKKAKKTALSETLNTIATKAHQRSLIIIISDFMSEESQETIFNAIQHLKHKKNEILCFHIKDNDSEKSLNFPNIPHEFMDIETGEKIKLNPSEIKKAYLEKTESSDKNLKERFAKSKVDYTEVDIHEDFNKALVSYFLKRKKMH